MKVGTNSIYNVVMSDCAAIKHSKTIDEAMIHKKFSFAFIEDMKRAGKISCKMKRFLKRKVITALVESGFEASENSRAFGNKYSHRYKCE